MSAYTLSKPIEFNGKTYSVLNFREPTGGVIAGILAAIRRKVPIAAAAYLSMSGNVPEDPKGASNLQEATSVLQRDLIASRRSRERPPARS